MSVMDEVSPRLRLVALMMINQVQSLARLHRAGLWKQDPAEIDAYAGRHVLQKLDASVEAQLWQSSATDNLLDAMNELTGGSLDRGRLESLAQRVSADGGGQKLLKNFL
ncbi:MAG: hypothetical protein AAF226_02985 [Verrucomicrobiota bacterium]